MNQQKAGAFLKELRKERNLTQEQLAEIFHVSSRSVSRWETGTNLPDLSILVEIADYYDVDIREIIDGERKNEMIKETKETLNKVAEYVEQDKRQLKKRIAGSCGAALILLIFCVVLDMTNGFNGFISQAPFDNIMGFTHGMTMSILLFTILFLTGKLDKIRKWKTKIMNRRK